MPEGWSRRPRRDNKRPCFREMAVGWRRGHDGDRSGARSGRTATETAADPAGGDADPPRADDRHLEEHTVAAGNRAETSQPGAAPSAGPDVPRTAGRPGRRPRG